MSPRSLRLATFVALALAAFPAAPPRADSAVGPCAPGEMLRRAGGGWTCEARSVQLASLGGSTYQTFALASASPAVTTRFAAACLGREDRVLSGTCVRRAAGGYVSFAGRATTTAAGEGVECALDGAESTSAVGIAICLDLPPLR